ncbi:MAG: hypothetical protein FWG34_00400 [Oscillospiraceae bacterium]|nr:hypothetical protein [Oscillospiraceae bacterium]
MSESKWSFAKFRDEGKIERGKETAQEMFLDGKNIIEIMVGGMNSGDLLYVTSIDRLLQAPRHDGEIRRLRWLRRSDQDDHARHLKRVCGVTFRGMAAKQCIFTAGSSPESEKAHFGLFHFVRNASSLCAAPFFAKHGNIYRVSYIKFLCDCHNKCMEKRLLKS